MMQQPGAQNAFDYSQLPQNTDFGNFDFSQYPMDQSFQDPSLSDPNAFAAGLNASQAPAYGSNLAPVAAPSTDLVRRARNHQLAPQVAQQEQWNGYNNMGGQNDDENEQELERKVANAKKDAAGKRKQIPPFVQKLSR